MDTPTTLKTTGLTAIHRSLGAKMAAFAGYDMPISYAGIKEEHQCVRNGVGLFDVSHMGEFIVKGKQALDLVHSVTSNNVKSLEIGQAQYSCLPNDTGGIVDDLLVYRLDEDDCSEGEMAFMLVVNAGNIEKDWNWIEKHNTFDTRLINISDQTGLLALQGPKAIAALQKLTETDLSAIKYYNFTKGDVAGISNVLISATGYTGSGGFELYVNNKDLAALWNALMEAGEEFGIQAIGLGARDTLRLEMGFCLYGNDINDTTSPIEAGLGWITKTKSGGEFPSVDVFRKQRTEGVAKKLMGFTMDGRRVPRHGYSIENASEEVIGEVTSGTASPSLGHPIGMGYIKKEFAKIDTEVMICIGSKKLPAKLCKPPFYKA